MNYSEAGFEVLTVVTTESTVSWILLMCRLEETRYFRGTYLPLPSGSESKPSKKPAEAGGKLPLA
jgi:hypothetical protein